MHYLGYCMKWPNFFLSNTSMYLYCPGSNLIKNTSLKVCIAWFTCVIGQPKWVFKLQFIWLSIHKLLLVNLIQCVRWKQQIRSLTHVYLDWLHSIICTLAKWLFKSLFTLVYMTCSIQMKTELKCNWPVARTGTIIPIT